MRDVSHDSTACGLRFGATHSGAGYQFANARDPAKNLIQISSSRFAPRATRDRQDFPQRRSGAEA